MDGPVGIANPPSTWTLETAYQYATARAIPPTDPDGEPLYNCPFPPCSKQFSKRFNLKAHLRVHTGDKPFACSFPGCSRRFMWKSSLTSHQAGHTRRKAELAKRNAALPHDQVHSRYPQWGGSAQENVSHHPPQPQNSYFQHHQQHQPQQHQQHQQQHQHQHQHQQQHQQHQQHQQQQQQQRQRQPQQLSFPSQPVSSAPLSYMPVDDPNTQPHLVSAPLPISQPISVSQPSHLHSSPFPTQSPYTTMHDRQIPIVQQRQAVQQQRHQQYPQNYVEERHRQRQQLLQEQQRELQRQQQRLREQECLLKQQQMQHEEEQRRLEQMKVHQEPMLDASNPSANSAIRATGHQLPTSSLGLPQQQMPPPSHRPPPAHPQRPPVPPTPNHSAQQLPSAHHRSLSLAQPPHRAQPQLQEQIVQKPPLTSIAQKQEQAPVPKQEDIPHQMPSRPPTSPVPPTTGPDLARLMKKEALAQPGKPSSSLLGHSSTHAMSSTTSLLPSPSASLGMPRSPNAFSQQFLFPCQASSPTWATTPNVPTPSGPGPSPMAVSPKPPNTPNNQMDVQMSNADHHAGDISPLPAELPASPSVTSPVPPPILPEVSNNRTRRIPNRSARPPLGGPSLSTGPPALLPPLANVAPANPPTHIDLGGLGMEDEPSSSLPALGSPHTELSPLPVASPIFGTAQTPTSPMQPFSPFSGMNASSARTKPTSTW